MDYFNVPYITKERREELELYYHEVGKLSAGDLNYMISTMLNKEIKARGLRYAVINELVGMLECCKLELYRVVAAEYEDTKMMVNGSVYEDFSDVK